MDWRDDKAKRMAADPRYRGEERALGLILGKGRITKALVQALVSGATADELRGICDAFRRQGPRLWGMFCAANAKRSAPMTFGGA